MVHSSPRADLVALAAANSLASFSRSYRINKNFNDKFTIEDPDFSI